jgi:uncharacterized protein (TIGR02246 family)
MRRGLVVLATLATLVGAVEQAYATSAKKLTLEEQSVYETYFAFTEAWNRGDAKAMAGLYATDADHVSADGQVAEGRDAIEVLYREQLTKTYRGGKLTLTLDSLRFLSDDVALANGQFEVSGLRDAQGNPLPALRGLHTDVWALRDGQWHVTASRSIVPFRGPPRAATAPTSATAPAHP